MYVWYARPNAGAPYEFGSDTGVRGGDFRQIRIWVLGANWERDQWGTCETSNSKYPDYGAQEATRTVRSSALFVLG